MRYLSVFAGFFTLGILTSACEPEAHKRLGHNVEDIEFVPTGPLAGHIAVLDGYDVYALRTQGEDGQPMVGSVERLFDFRQLPLASAPRGITYLPPLEAFAVNDPAKNDRLFLFDSRGAPRPPLLITYRDAFVPFHTEALTYLPEDSDLYPNSIVMVAIQAQPSLQSRLEIIDLNGQVLAEIVPQDPLGSGFIAALSYQAPNHFLVTGGDNRIYTIDLNGAIVAGPTTLSEAQSVEGLAVTRDGRVAVTDYFQGRVYFFDGGLERLRTQDQSYHFGLNVSFPLGLAWDAERQQFLVEHVSPTGLQITAVDPGLDRAHALFPLANPSGTNRGSASWLPGEERLAISLPNSHLLLFERNGTVAGDIDLSAYAPVRQIEYVPDWQQFVLMTGKAGEEKTLHVVDRGGKSVRDILIDTPSLNRLFSMTYLERGREVHFLVTDDPRSGHALLEIDDQGRVIREADYRSDLNLMQPVELAWITSGPLRGKIAAVDAGSSELVVFRVP